MSGRTGWTYGDVSTGVGQWLTVFGSAHKSPVLWETREQALQHLSESAAFGQPDKIRLSLHIVVAHVTEVTHPGVYPGYAYKITAGSVTEPLTERERVALSNENTGPGWSRIAVIAARGLRARLGGVTIPDVTAPCRHCGTSLHIEPSAPLDEFVWVDTRNARMGDDTDIPPNAYRHLAQLGDRMEASKYTDQAAAREYSALKVRLALGGTTHEHYPQPDAPPIPWGLPVPECCGWPMWLRPSGWHCRQRCGTIMAHGGVRR